MIAYLATTHFDASRDLQETLYPYQKIYNYHVPQKNIGHITPIQALKDWHKKQPELFKKKIYDLHDCQPGGFHTEIHMKRRRAINHRPFPS